MNELTPERIDQLLAEQKKNAQMLIRRDYELQKANEQLQALDTEKSEFISIAAHQLRTPLSAIRWIHQMLLDGEVGLLTEEQQSFLSQAQQTVFHMTSMVNDLLNADHLEFGQVTYNFQKTNLGKLLTSVIQEFQPLADEKKLRFDHSFPGDLPPVRADVERLKDAFGNLLSNAIKYTPENGKIGLTAEHIADHVSVFFSDSGIGIPEKNRADLFKKFTRFDNAKKIHADGSGLGLFIVKKIIEAHKGVIIVESELHKGTTFKVMLPIHD